MRTFLRLALFLAATFATAPSNAATSFGAGGTFMSAFIGNGNAFNKDYVILGLGVHYFVLDGLGVGLSYEEWAGSSPNIQKVTPSIEYVFDNRSGYRPYFGVFYRRAIFSGMGTLNATGARGGMYMDAGSRMVVGLGLAYESYLNCNQTVYNSCTETYPEASVIFAF